MTHDVRAIANYVLDYADDSGRTLTNMQINKIVYFLHADYLAAFERPLVTAKIEAWDHGPVFRELYQEFKEYSDQPIRKRLTRVSPISGKREYVSYQLAQEEISYLADVCSKYVGMTASALRTLSHIEGGPWDLVWNHDTNTKASMRITDEAILAWYKDAKH